MVMVINAHACCLRTAGIGRKLSGVAPPGCREVPYGSVCRESEHIALFRIRLCSQRSVASTFNIVINSRSVYVGVCVGSSHTHPCWKQDVCSVSPPDTSFHNSKSFPSWHPTSSPSWHRFPKESQNPWLQCSCLWAWLFNGPYSSVCSPNQRNFSQQIISEGNFFLRK